MIEATILAAPQQDLQLVAVIFPETDTTLTKNLWSILIDNSLTWAHDGWGALINAGSAIYVNPVLSPAGANTSMKPLIDFGNSLLEMGVEGAMTVQPNRLVSTAFSEGSVSELPSDSSVSGCGSETGSSTDEIHFSKF